jgi:phosphoribosylamine--glycine ligase
MSGGTTLDGPIATGPIATVCVVGSGGREHALAVALGRTADVVVTPGNPGIAGITDEGHTMTSVEEPVEGIDADLYVIGPEAPLVDGLADRLRASGKLVFGPGADGARLGGSKAFMKEMLAEADSGPDTGGMGAYSPVPFVDDSMVAALLAEVAAGRLVTTPVFAARPAVCVVLAAEGYPESPRTGDVITGLDRAAAYRGVAAVHWAGMHYRTDIAAHTEEHDR